MKETILIKVGEIALKGLNRRSFEDVLIKNIKRRVNCITPCEVKIAQSTIAVTPYKDDVDFDEEMRRHLVQIEFFMHERLIHLLVTILFAILTVGCCVTFVVTEKYRSYC